MAGGEQTWPPSEIYDGTLFGSTSKGACTAAGWKMTFPAALSSATSDAANFRQNI